MPYVVLRASVAVVFVPVVVLVVVTFLCSLRVLSGGPLPPPPSSSFYSFFLTQTPTYTQLKSFVVRPLPISFFNFPVYC